VTLKSNDAEKSAFPSHSKIQYIPIENGFNLTQSKKIKKILPTPNFQCTLCDW